jgi:hypothetical protein
MIARGAGARPAPDLAQPEEAAASYQIEHRPLAVVRDWHQFRQAFRDRCTELRVSRLTVDRIGRLPDGQASKLLSAVPDQGFGVRSLPAMLAAVGLALVVVEDAEATARIRPHLVPRNESQVHADASALTLKREKRRAKRRGKAWRNNSEWGRVMAARRSLILSPNKRQRIARRAARARWKKPGRKAQPS